MVNCWLIQALDLIFVLCLVSLAIGCLTHGLPPPFRDITPPSSFDELLDFIEVFLNTPHEGFRLFYGTAGDKREYLSELFRDNLLEGWILRCRDAGMPVVFSDPTFIELAGRAQKLYKRLLKVDFKQKVSTKVRYLLAGRQQYGFSFNQKDTFTCANIIPLRITADQPSLFNVRMVSLQSFLLVLTIGIKATISEREVTQN